MHITYKYLVGLGACGEALDEWLQWENRVGRKLGRRDATLAEIRAYLGKRHKWVIWLAGRNTKLYRKYKELGIGPNMRTIESGEFAVTPLEWAIMHGNRKLITEMICDGGKPPNRNQGLWTALKKKVSPRKIEELCNYVEIVYKTHKRGIS